MLYPSLRSSYFLLQIYLCYIPRRDCRVVYFSFNNKFQKKRKTRVSMGKNIKSYATTQAHFPREREGSLTAKSPNLLFKIRYGLTIHIIRF